MPAPPLQILIDRGASVPHPDSVFVSPEVDPDRVHPSVTLHPGTRLRGAGLSIGPDCVLGAETPVTVDDCRLGREVNLKGGFHQGSVYYDGASMGSAAHVRPGCLIEEQAGGAHAVGLKQTILLPFVTLGSLVNFCDALMAGGTSRKDHSEVGSSFIHFNFTPHGDKATPSLFGEVARGALLDQRPVFLGGQGGVVGPVEMAYGTVQAAGSVSRRDLPEPDHLYRSAAGKELYLAYRPGRVRDPAGKLIKNLRYIGNLSALRLWTREVRTRRLNRDAFDRACVEGALDLLDAAVAERRKRLAAWGDLVVGDDPGAGARWVATMEALDRERGAEAAAPELAEPAGREAGGGYLEFVRGLTAEDRTRATERLQQEINRFVRVADLFNQEI